MKRLYICLLATAVVLVCMGSIAVADCNPTTYKCRSSSAPAYEIVGYSTLGNCTYWSWEGPYCQICGKKYRKAAVRCNEEHPKKCKGACLACVPDDLSQAREVGGRCVNTEGTIDEWARY